MKLSIKEIPARIIRKCEIMVEQNPSMKPRQIAEILDVDVQLIYRIIHRRDFETKGRKGVPPRKRTEEDVSKQKDLVAKLLEFGMKHLKITDFDMIKAIMIATAHKLPRSSEKGNRNTA